MTAGPAGAVAAGTRTAAAAAAGAAADALAGRAAFAAARAGVAVSARITAKIDIHISRRLGLGVAGWRQGQGRREEEGAQGRFWVRALDALVFFHVKLSYFLGLGIFGARSAYWLSRKS
ncbi:MAG: hypothetical protein LBP33_11440 [Candidatus Adiutrix sp.]|nr:hypothetical protein [Candidatus Adiutrix sp.]